jgi:hypothetical protein
MQRSENWMTNLAGSSKEGCVSKKAVLSMMMMKNTNWTKLAQIMNQLPARLNMVMKVWST